jgi:hypothetical protein
MVLHVYGRGGHGWVPIRSLWVGWGQLAVLALATLMMPALLFAVS